MKKILPLTAVVSIIIMISLNGISKVEPAAPLDDILLYTTPDNLEPIIGETVNVTVVLKHALNTTESIRNGTLEFSVSSNLNITNFNDYTFDPETYNSTEYYLNVDNTSPYIFWNESYVNITWAKIDHLQMNVHWFLINCTSTGLANVLPFQFHYYIGDEEETINGESFSFEIIEEPVHTYLDVPYREPSSWFWWLAGSIILGVPLIVIIITRLTLWK